MQLLNSEIERIFIKMQEWVRQENYAGYDPYDWGMSPLSNKLPYYLNLLMSQINLYSPINFRKIWGIKKGTSNKSLALFAQAYLKYYRVSKKAKFLKEAFKVLELLERNSIHKDMRIGWASYYFPFIRKSHVLSPTQVDIIATSEALKAYSLAYNISKDAKYRDMTDKIIALIISDFLGDYKGYICIKYFPSEKGKIVFNVSGLVLSAFSEYLKHVEKRKDIIDVGTSLFEFLAKYQERSGVWPYSYFPKERTFHYQIDYHQGFIIDGLVDFYPFVTDKDMEYFQVINKGVNYYKSHQFHPNGFSYYRIPRKYPIDIHNQAQGIITFSNLYEKFGNKEYLYFAWKITRWTIESMWDPSGYFYTHKWPIITNKIPYIRWGQAWMMLAIATLMCARRKMV